MSTKLEQACEAVQQSGKRVILLTGKDSPIKKEFAEAVVKFLVTKLIPTTKLGPEFKATNGTMYVDDEEYRKYFVTIVMGIDRITSRHADRCALFLKRRLSDTEWNRFLIIPVVSMKVLEEKLGEDLIDFISPSALEVDLNTAREEIPKV